MINDIKKVPYNGQCCPSCGDAFFSGKKAYLFDLSKIVGTETRLGEECVHGGRCRSVYGNIVKNEFNLPFAPQGELILFD